jgi:hypothetical protein
MIVERFRNRIECGLSRRIRGSFRSAATSILPDTNLR